MNRILGDLVERLGKAHGARLSSVILYGSAASEDHVDRFSDYNVLCVLPQVTPDELAASEPVFRWWRELGNPSPLLLSEAEVRTSSDCFPLEFHDICERHQVLFGRDVMAGVEIDDSYYRARLEYELRSKLLRLRQRAAGILSEGDLLLRLMADSLSTFCVLLRHALRLAGQAVTFLKREVVARASAHFGLDPSPFDTLLDLREGKVKPNELDPKDLFRRYLAAIQGAVDAVDRLAK